FLIYGQPGNGKTALAEALFRVETAPIYMPFAIECQGNIVQLYDPIYHQKIDDLESDSTTMDRDHGFDRRWFKCRRPFIITGGEMTVPFEAFLIFSTNLRPDQLGDEAFLRRIQYKMFLRSPAKNEFVVIFERFAESRLLDCPPGLIDAFVAKHYEKGGKRYRR